MGRSKSPAAGFSPGGAADVSQGRKPLVKGPNYLGSPRRGGDRAGGVLPPPLGASGLLGSATQGLRPGLTSAAAPRLETESLSPRTIDDWQWAIGTDEHPDPRKRTAH